MPLSAWYIPFPKDCEPILNILNVKGNIVCIEMYKIYFTIKQSK